MLNCKFLGVWDEGGGKEGGEGERERGREKCLFGAVSFNGISGCGISSPLKSCFPLCG